MVVWVLVRVSSPPIWLGAMMGGVWETGGDMMCLVCADGISRRGVNTVTPFADQCQPTSSVGLHNVEL